MHIWLVTIYLRLIKFVQSVGSENDRNRIATRWRILLIYEHENPKSYCPNTSFEIDCWFLLKCVELQCIDI